MSAAHFELLALGRRQLELAEAGAWDELALALADWQRRADALPPVAPADASEALGQLAAAHARLQSTLEAARADTVRELGALPRRRRAVHGYQGAAPTAGAQVDGAG